MEDISTTSNAYTKDELAAMVRHPVVSEVSKILNLQSEIEEIAVDDNRSKNDVQQETREHVERMTEIWSLLGPATTIARRLYPARAHLFDLLDKSLSLQESFENWSNGKSLQTDRVCEKLCCKKQLL